MKKLTTKIKILSWYDIVIITLGFALLVVPRLLYSFGCAFVEPFISMYSFTGILLLSAEAFFAIIFILIALLYIRNK